MRTIAIVNQKGGTGKTTTAVSQEIVAKLRAHFPQTLAAVIRENVRLAECPSMGEPITAYAPTSAGAEDYGRLAEEVINQEKDHE